MALCGIGFGLFQSPNNRTIISSAPRQRSGAAGGMLATARLLGQTTGAVVVGIAFHILGVGAAPELLAAAGIAALIAADLACFGCARRGPCPGPTRGRRSSTKRLSWPSGLIGGSHEQDLIVGALLVAASLPSALPARPRFRATSAAPTPG